MELIDKEALLKAIGRDSDGIMGQYGDEWLFVETIESMPIIQLVNCKDCFHGREMGGEWVCMFRGELVKADGYCHKAELRGEIDGTDKQRRTDKQDKRLHDNDSRRDDGSEVDQ